MPKPLAFLATVIAVCLLVPAAPAAANDYSVAIPTQTIVEAPPRTTPGTTADAEITVSANADGGPLTGTLTVSVRASDAGGVERGPLTRPRTVAYNGSPVTVTLPGQSVGEYVVAAAFTPSDPQVYGPSQGADTYVVGAGQAPGPGPDPNPGGILPDTGGPHSGWLLLGMLMLGLGGGAVVYARRRGTLAV
jgi:LPXTG-motif cell wall-anchored protein